MDEQNKSEGSQGQSDRRTLYVILIIFLLLAIVALIFLLSLYAGWSFIKKKDSTLSPTATVVESATALSTLTEETAEAPLSENDEQARIFAAVSDVANNFMAQRQERDYEGVKAYVDDEFLAKYDQESFAGASSPSMSGYTLGEVFAGGDRYEVPVTVSWSLNGEFSNTSAWKVYVIPVDANEYKVFDYEGSYE